MKISVFFNLFVGCIVSPMKIPVNSLLILNASGVADKNFIYHILIAGIYLLLIVLIFLLFKLIRKIVTRTSVTEPSQGDVWFESLLGDARLVMYKTDLLGNFILVTNFVYQLTGYSKEELQGKNYSLLIDEDDYPELRQHYLKQVESGIKETVLEFCILLKNGKRKWVEQIAVLRYDDLGKVSGFQCIIKDIDYRKKLQAGLREVEKDKRSFQLLLQAILDNSPSLIFAKDTLGNYLLVNKKFEEIFGLRGKSVIGKNDFYFNPPELAEKYMIADQWVTTNRQIRRDMVRLMSHEGEKEYMVVKFPLLNDSNEITCLCGLAYDVTEQVKKQKELEKSREVAENAEKAQEHFLANVSHEMRTPLNGIMGMNNLLASTELDEEQKEYVGAIRETSETLLVLINDLLDLSKIKAGKLTIETIDFDPRKLCANSFAGLQHQAKEKKLDFIIQIDPAIPPVLKGDSYRLRQILINLMGNAVKFTQAGFVKLEVSLLEKRENSVLIRFEVADSGIGIPKDKIVELFKEFTQIGTDTSRKYGGTGLGLAITKQLVAIQNGEIKVESNQGAGAKFIVTIPYGFEDTPAEDKTPEAFSFQSFQELFKGRCLLIVEDNIINQKVVAHPLQKAGARLVIASDGKEAVDELQRGLKPDIILMDLGMPVMDGYETTFFIRNELKSEVPIIAMTASGVTGEKEKCLKHGMNGYVSKPLSMKSLFKIIYAILQDTSAGKKDDSETEIKHIGSNHYDLSYLDEMEDKEYSQEILSRFLKDTPLLLAQLDKEVEHADWVSVFQKAHKLKSGLGLLKMDLMLDFIVPIETMAREQKTVEEIPALLRQANIEYKIVVPLLEEELMKLVANTQIN